MNSSCFIFLQLKSICMEVVYKCEVLNYCFQNQQTEEKTMKERSGRVALWTLHKINVGFQGSILAAKEIIPSANIFLLQMKNFNSCLLFDNEQCQSGSFHSEKCHWTFCFNWWFLVVLYLHLFLCLVDKKAFVLKPCRNHWPHLNLACNAWFDFCQLVRTITWFSSGFRLKFAMSESMNVLE